jgi:transmembrane sensor
MDTQRLYQLFERYAAQTASPAEQQELFALVHSGPEAELKAALQQLQQATGPDTEFYSVRWQPVLDRILATARTLETEEAEGEETAIHRIFPWTRMAAAAAITGLLVGGTWLWTQRRSTPDLPIAATVQKDIAPGGNRATLTLANGRIIVLDSAANGTLAILGTTQIQKTSNDRITYFPPKRSPGRGPAEGGIQGGGAGVENNTLTTPRGGQYQLTLPDGTRVWLNAESSITYPTAFVENQRLVKITGEAYFEVAKDPGKPFNVQVNPGAEVRVLGTSFNINAYSDEPVMATTLLEGSIRFSEDGGDKKEPGTLLKPGQQIQLSKSDDVKLVDHADIDRVMAWRNGQFPLKGTDMAALMRQVARWYDVDVHFNGPVPQKTFGGSISRNTNLSAVLLALKENGVDCRLEGKTIEVANNKPNP